MDPANAAVSQTTTDANPVTIFKSTRANGEQFDGILTFSVFNHSSVDGAIRCNGFCEEDEWGPLLAGKATTIEVKIVPDSNSIAQIDLVEIKRLTSDITISWLCTGRR